MKVTPKQNMDRLHSFVYTMSRFDPKKKPNVNARMDRKPFILKDFIKKVEQEFNYSLADLKDRRRDAPIMEVRGVLYVFFKFDLGWTTTNIARLFDRNHSSIVTTANKYRFLIDNEIDYLTTNYAKIHDIYGDNYCGDE